MTDDGQERYQDDADESEARAPAGESAEPHHALNTPVDAIGEDAEAALGTQEDAAERIENAEDEAEDERAVEDRSRRA
jgi:hypothetical protein